MRAFAASAPRLRTVKTFLQTLPAIQEIPRELHGCRVLAVASVLAPLRPYGEPLLDLSAAVPHAVVTGR